MGRLLSAKPLVAPSRQPLRATSLPTAPIAAKAQPVDVPDSTQRIAFFFALAMMFVRISILPEILAHVTHTNTFLLYIVSPPAILALLASGGIGRAYRAAPTWCWTGVFICMILSTPFSSWVGGSSARVIAYAKTDFICLLMFSGTVVRWSEIRKVASMLAAAGLMVVMIAKIWAKAGPDGRLALAFDGIISNPNDLAAHLVLLLPFVLLYAIAKGRNMVIRVVLFGAIGQGLWSILGTASRGAMISVAIMCAMLFIRGKASHRMLMMAGVPILLTGLIIAAPDRILLRLTTLFVSHAASEATAEADESTAARAYLLQKSLEYTLKNPVFGVGPGQFSTYEGLAMRSLGKQGNWHETHNSYTQMSSECGVPALILMLCAMFGTIRMVNKSYKRAKKQGSTEVAEYCSYYLVSMIGYCITITFLACAYRFTLPAMISLGVALYYAAERQLNLELPTNELPSSPHSGLGLMRLA